LGQDAGRLGTLSSTLRGERAMSFHVLNGDDPNAPSSGYVQPAVVTQQLEPSAIRFIATELIEEAADLLRAAHITRRESNLPNTRGPLAKILAIAADELEHAANKRVEELRRLP
jgi:hypothetical protein